MNPYRRSPLVLVTTALVYFFLYAPIIVLVLYSFNSSKANVTFDGFIPSFGNVRVEAGILFRARVDRSTGSVSFLKIRK